MKTFRTKLFKYPGPGGWTFAPIPAEEAPAPTHPWGRTPVVATVDGRTWRTSVWRDATHGTLLPVPKRIRGAKGDGDEVEVVLLPSTAYADDGPPATLFTIGYEGATLEAFLQALREAGIEQVVDVRERPSSRKPGFSKGRLSEALASAGIAYHHVRELGTPAELRRARSGGLAWGEFAPRYARHLALQGAALEWVTARVRARRVALLCFEAEAGICHRSMVADELRRRGAVGRVHHLLVPRGSSEPDAAPAASGVTEPDLPEPA